MIRTLHNDLNANIMISVWPKYYVGTNNYEAMNSKGYLYRRNVDKGQKDWIGYVSTSMMLSILMPAQHSGIS